MNNFVTLIPATPAQIVAIHTGNIMDVGFSDPKELLIAIIVVNYIHPFTEKITDKLLNKITPIMFDVIIKVLSIIIIIDFILSSISYLA